MKSTIKSLDKSYFPFALSDLQAKTLKAYLATSNSSPKAARSLGTNERTVRSTLQRILKQAAKSGYSPLEDANGIAPTGFIASGKSTLYDSEGNIVSQWVKTKRDEEDRIDQIKEFIRELSEPLKGLAKPVKAPKSTTDELLSAYVIGDAHFGMYAWAEETLSDDYDSDIAERDHKQAIDYLVNAAPESDIGLLVNVGDFLHADNRKNQTPQSGNILDVDGRFQRVRKIALFTLRYMIEQMLLKHKKVVVINAQGNHDIESSGWLSIALSMYYERDPRVEINMSPSKNMFYRWEKNIFMVSHGDTMKMEKLPMILANHEDGRPWGECPNRDIFTGHIHHKNVLELGGATVRSFSALPPPDAWHSENGYGQARREMNLLVYDAKHGNIGGYVWNVSRRKK